MPMHDWARVRPGTYHHFHYRWVAAIADLLNSVACPAGILRWPSNGFRGRNPTW
jgi:hypothetical protein